MNNAADEIVILSDALEALRLRTEELEQKLDTTAQPLAAASVALGGALDGIKALQFHVRDSNLGALSGRIEELRASVAEKIEAFSTQLVDAGKRLESEQRQNVDGLRVELGAIGSAVAALSKKFDSELARIETDAKAEFSRIEQIKLQVGPEGRSLNPRGTFVDGETYNRLDVVSWLGSSYIAAVDGVTEKPSKSSNQWQVLAQRGVNIGGPGLPDAIKAIDGGQIEIDGVNIGGGAVSTSQYSLGKTNTFLGQNALRSAIPTGASNGQYNTAIGINSCRYITTGSYNVGIGPFALKQAQTADSNLAIGPYALESAVTGVNNTIAIGGAAGSILTTGAYNTFIGISSQPSSSIASNEIVIGYSLAGKGSQTAFIGGTSGAYNAANTNTWQTTSDERLKKQIEDASGGLEIVEEVKVRTFLYREENEITDLPTYHCISKSGEQIGVVAQELEQVLPQCVSTNLQDIKSVNTDRLFWNMVLAIQQLSKRVKELENA